MNEKAPFTFTWQEFEAACVELAKMVKASGYQPDVIAGLETGGVFVAGMLKKLLGVETMVALDVVEVAGVYRLGGLAQLDRLRMAGKRLLGVDDGIRTGNLLLVEMPQLAARLGAELRCASMVGIGDYPRDPNLFVARDLSVAPRLPWKLSPI